MGLPQKLELGCGREKPAGFYGVDIVDTPESDQVIDLDTEDWPLPDDHFTRIRAIDVFEHLEHPLQFLEEIHRIGQDGCTVELRAPHQSSQNWTDPTHHRLCGWNTIRHYTTTDGAFNYYSDARFHIQTQELQFIDAWWTLPARVLKPWFHRHPTFYENTAVSRIFPAYNIYYRLEVVK